MRRLGILAFLAVLTILPLGLRAEGANKIDGMAISRPDGTYLGVQVISNHFKITFYDKKKKKMAPNVTSAVLWWPVHYQPNAERTELTDGGDGSSLSSEKVVRAPLSFVLHISLFQGDKPDPVETYVIDFQG